MRLGSGCGFPHVLHRHVRYLGICRRRIPYERRGRLWRYLLAQSELWLGVGDLLW